MGLPAEQVSGTMATPRETRSPSSADLGACGKDIWFSAAAAMSSAR